MRKLLLLPVIALSLVACGSDSEPAASEPAASEPAPSEPAPTEPPTTEAPTTEAPTPEAPTPEPAGGAAVELNEWAIVAPTEYAAGSVTFEVANTGSFPHELVVIAGDGYQSLPLAANGAVIEDELPAGALLGRTDRLASGSSGSLTVELAPGNYVLVCNIAVGPNSHAGAGQTLDIVVS